MSFEAQGNGERTPYDELGFEACKKLSEEAYWVTRYLQSHLDGRPADVLPVELAALWYSATLTSDCEMVTKHRTGAKAWAWGYIQRTNEDAQFWASSYITKSADATNGYEIAAALRIIPLVFDVTRYNGLNRLPSAHDMATHDPGVTDWCDAVRQHMPEVAREWYEWLRQPSYLAEATNGAMLVVGASRLSEGLDTVLSG